MMNDNNNNSNVHILRPGFRADKRTMSVAQMAALGDPGAIKRMTVLGPPKGERDEEAVRAFLKTLGQSPLLNTPVVADGTGHDDDEDEWSDEDEDGDL